MSYGYGMAANNFILGLDLGTSSTKAVVWSADNQPAATGQAAVKTAAPRPGFGEQDAEDWWRSTRKAVRQCLRDVNAERIAAIGISVQRETFVLLDAAHKPVAPAILWYDARGAAALPRLQQRLKPEDYQKATGKQFDITSAVCKAVWLQRHCPDILARTAVFADVMAYLSSRLTGKLTTTYAGADTTGLIDLRRRTWYEPHLRAAGLTPAQMPELVPAGTVLGALQPAAARALGLAAGLPVVAGGGDGHCFAFGAGGGQPDNATLTLGTSACLALPCAKPLRSEFARTLIACAPDQYLLESVVQCGSATVAWFQEDFLPGRATATRYADFEAKCAAVPAGCDGLLVLPHWRGVRTPHNDPDARGVTLGWSDHHTAAHFQRAIMEGVALEISTVLRALVRSKRLSIKQLVVGGGGARSNTWCSILADVTALPVRRPASLEAAALGAALLARQAVGVGGGKPGAEPTRFDPAPANTRLYRRLAGLQQQAYHSTRDISHQL